MTETPFIVVFDTNIFVRVALGRSRRARAIRQAWQAGEFVIAASRAILQELERVLHYPEVQGDYHLSDAEIAAFIRLVGQTVILTDELYQVETIEADASDNVFLACALEAGADYLVSEDTHLRYLKYYHGIHLIGLEQLADLVAAE